MEDLDSDNFKSYFYGRFELKNHYQSFQPVAKFLNTLKANRRFDLLFSVLQDQHDRPYEYQKIAAGLMLKVDATYQMSISEATLPVLNSIDLSIQEFPFLLAKRHGRDRVLAEFAEIESTALSAAQRTRLDALIYWVRGFTEERYEELRQRWSARIKG